MIVPISATKGIVAVLIARQIPIGIAKRHEITKIIGPVIKLAIVPIIIGIAIIAI